MFFFHSFMIQKIRNYIFLLTQNYQCEYKYMNVFYRHCNFTVIYNKNMRNNLLLFPQQACVSLQD